jgi:hypothetical protein
MMTNELIWVRLLRFFVVMCACLVSIAATSLIAAGAGTASAEHWEVQGRMSEACTCQVPCTCNFGQGPSPHHFCWSIASFQILKGHYGAVDLGGLRLVRAHGNKSIVWYVDSRATSAQATALEAIGKHLSRSKRVPLRFVNTRISQSTSGHRFAVTLGDHGGFEADAIIGQDGKNPIVVENMTAWNVVHDVKGKTRWLRYRDGFGNQFDFKDTNANQGIFDWTDHTASYF